MQVWNSFFSPTFSFFKRIIYLALTLLGLHCCARNFSSCKARGGYSVLAVHRLPWLRSFPRWAQGAWMHRLGLSCATGLSSSPLRGTVLDQGLNPVSSAVAGGFLSTGPLGEIPSPAFSLSLRLVRWSELFQIFSCSIVVPKVWGRSHPGRITIGVILPLKELPFS